MWDPSGLSLHAAARLHERIVMDGTAAPLEAELRQHYDRHGLSPKAMLQLRWRVGELGDLEEPESEPETPKPAPKARKGGDARRRRLMRSIDGGKA